MKKALPIMFSFSLWGSFCDGGIVPNVSEDDGGVVSTIIEEVGVAANDLFLPRYEESDSGVQLDGGEELDAGENNDAGFFDAGVDMDDAGALYERDAGNPDAGCDFICHHGRKDLCIPDPALINAHLKHGDYMGECE